MQSIRKVYTGDRANILETDLRTQWQSDRALIAINHYYACTGNRNNSVEKLFCFINLKVVGPLITKL